MSDDTEVVIVHFSDWQHMESVRIACNGVYVDRERPGHYARHGMGIFATDGGLYTLERERVTCPDCKRRRHP